MTINENPWTGIEKPASDFNVLRVDPGHRHDFFWGINAKGDYFLLLEVSEQHKEYLEKSLIELKGIRTDLRTIKGGKLFFIVSLRSKEYLDIFYRLCLDLVDSTKQIEEQKTALEIVHSRLKRWRNFLSRGTDHLLTAQEVQGLFAELTFFYDCLKTSGNIAAVTSGWQGPLGGPHDFILGKYAVEVKSVAGSQKDFVRISSENQLVSHLEKLFLHVYFLAESMDGADGVSLNQMVEKIWTEIGEEDSRELFDSKLYEAGYIELKEYDSPCFLITGQKTYEVREGFPRITPDALSAGLANVSYDLSLKFLNEYGCGYPYQREDIW